MTTFPSPWCAQILTLFPEIFPGPLGYSLAGKAMENGQWKAETVNIRDFALDRHRTVDDTPFGGGPGMVLKPDVIHAAMTHATQRTPSSATAPRVFLTPRGKPLTQEKLAALSQAPEVILLCGHYEGVDQRVLDHWSFEDVCIGDFVLSGGEMAALTLLDGIVRLLPGVIGSSDSLLEESFQNDLLEYPQYTRPQVWEGYSIPEILISGHHKNIQQWRRKESEHATQSRRPDLWQRHLDKISKLNLQLLKEKEVCHEHSASI